MENIISCVPSHHVKSRQATCASGLWAQQWRHNGVQETSFPCLAHSLSDGFIGLELLDWLNRHFAEAPIRGQVLWPKTIWHYSFKGRRKKKKNTTQMLRTIQELLKSKTRRACLGVLCPPKMSLFLIQTLCPQHFHTPGQQEEIKECDIFEGMAALPCSSLLPASVIEVLILPCPEISQARHLPSPQSTSSATGQWKGMATGKPSR